jgi:subtilisin family serine protease
VHVGIYDGGVDLGHEDLKSSYDGTRNITYGGVTYNGSPDDDPNAGIWQFHGTCVAGLIVGTGNNGTGIIGVAHGADFTSVNILDESSRLYFDGRDQRGILAAFYHMAALDVVNQSWNVAQNYSNTPALRAHVAES